MTQEEYVRVQKKESLDEKFNKKKDGSKAFDLNASRKGGFSSTRQTELVAIAEFISMNKIAEEIPRRKYDSNEIWNSL